MTIIEPTSPSLEDEVIRKEEFQALLNQADEFIEKWEGFVHLFIDRKDLLVYQSVRLNNMPVRNAAMTYHMSRRHIHQTVRRTERKIEHLRNLVGLIRESKRGGTKMYPPPT